MNEPFSVLLVKMYYVTELIA